jgi:hypothetical protein
MNSLPFLTKTIFVGIAGLYCIAYLFRRGTAREAKRGEWVTSVVLYLVMAFVAAIVVPIFMSAAAAREMTREGYKPR